MSTTRIAQLTDLHVIDFADLRPRDMVTKRVTGWLNHRLHRSGAHDMQVLDAAIAAVCEDGPDHLVVTGDLTNLALPSEFRAARLRLDPVVRSGIPVTAIPGNHDVYLAGSVGVLERELEDLLAPEAGDGGGWPRLLRIGPVSLVHVNTAVATPPFMAWGRVGDEQLARLERVCSAERDAGQAVVIAAHHHPDRAPARRSDERRNLRDGPALRALCRRCGVDLLLHGHNHHHQVRRLADAPSTVASGLGSASLGLAARPEKRAAVGRYTFTGPRLTGLHFRMWDATRDAFSPWVEVSLDALPAPGRDAPFPGLA